MAHAMERSAGPRAERERRALPPGAWARLLPAALAVLLAVPTLRFGYIWDDYLFLAHRGDPNPLALLLPAPGEPFYRPVSQGLYFLLLGLVDPSSGAVAHVLNLLLLATACTLLTLLVTRLAGLRAGLLSGFAFAAMGATPSLVAWVSCVQDLLAIAFVLAALLLRHARREFAAVGCAAVALLCKESAAAVFPLLWGWDLLLGRPRRSGRGAFAASLVVLAAWIALHPALRLLAERGLSAGATGYVGLAPLDRGAGYLIRYATTFLNLPPASFAVAWPAWSLPVLAAGLGVIALGTWRAWAEPDEASDAPRVPLPRLALLAALFAVPSLLLPAFLIRHWAPYFACVPAIGAAMLAGPLLARRTRGAAFALLAIYLVLGVRYRGAASPTEAAWTEPVFAEAADAAALVRGRLRSLLPALPRGSQVVVSSASTGTRGIFGTLAYYHALRVWYRDPTIRTVTTRTWTPPAGPEFLVRITPDLDVLVIDPDARRARSATPHPPDLAEVDRPLVNYARAVAAAGDADRAIRIVESLARAAPPDRAAHHRRVIAAILAAAGRGAEADSVMRGLPATAEPIGEE